ncbi:MAG TPA: hypothetical protein DCY20_07920 [Firmicutes bacterium]|nr:hypothetical protein [Bacillota bacterium]
MEIVNRVESLIFRQALNYPIVQILQNKTVIINDKCLVDHFSEEYCIIQTPTVQYVLAGTNLRIKEYGDYVLKIESDGVKKIEIVGDNSEK